MGRVVFFIDGFNVYHSIQNPPVFRQYKWLDYSTLCKKFVTKKDSVDGIYYFTALPPWDQNKRNRHKNYIRALRTTGVQPVYGKFKLVDKKCRGNCKKWYRTHEEKLTDVNIASFLFKLAVSDSYDTAVLMTGDTDLLPAVEAVRECYGNKKIGFLFPIGRATIALKNIADFYSRIKIKHLSSSLFPRKVDLGGGVFAESPADWLPASLPPSP